MVGGESVVPRCLWGGLIVCRVSRRGWGMGSRVVSRVVGSECAVLRLGSWVSWVSWVSWGVSRVSGVGRVRQSNVLVSTSRHARHSLIITRVWPF